MAPLVPIAAGRGVDGLGLTTRVGGMEVKFGITDIAREVTIETLATPDEIADQIRTAVENSSLVDLTDDKGRRILVPASKIGYVDLGAPAARAVGFGTV